MRTATQKIISNILTTGTFMGVMFLAIYGLGEVAGKIADSYQQPSEPKMYSLSDSTITIADIDNFGTEVTTYQDGTRYGGEHHIRQNTLDNVLNDYPFMIKNK